MNRLLSRSSWLLLCGWIAVGGLAVCQAALPGQPFASYWHPSTLLAWDPAADPDAPFNRANTPIAAQFLNPALNVNAHARPNEARVTSLAAFASTSGNPSQGGLSMSYYALNYWQYIDVLVFWGGSAGEGLILAPNPTVIDAAHRNGVAVLGNVFLPPTAYGGQIQWVRDFVQKSGTTFPVADKLIQVAQLYGFDGWFINQETAGGDAALATSMRDFLKYIQTNSTLRIMWYDSMTESGSVSWQNALTASNDAFLQDGSRVADDVFLNFWWSASGLASSRTRAQSLGRSGFDLYAGVDVEANGYNTSVSWSALFPEGQAHVTSLGFYRPEWTRNSSSSVADFYARDNSFWAGWNRDPSNTATTNAWKGVAHYVPAKSPVNRLPFVTGFNTGHGSRYAVNGVTVRSGEWNNLSVQDVLPHLALAGAEPWRKTGCRPGLERRLLGRDIAESLGQPDGHQRPAALPNQPACCGQHHFAPGLSDRRQRRGHTDEGQPRLRGRPGGVPVSRREHHHQRRLERPDVQPGPLCRTGHRRPGVAVRLAQRGEQLHPARRSDGRVQRRHLDAGAAGGPGR